MMRATSLREIKDRIDNDEIVLLYISRRHCSVCHALLPQIERLLRDFPAIKAVYADADDLPDIAGAFLVFTVPTILVFLHGKEMIRKSRFIPVERFRHDLEKVMNYR